MEIRNKRQYVVLLIHILVWSLLGFVLLLYPPHNFGVKLPPEFWIVQSVHLLLLVIFFYYNALVAVPEYLLRQKGVRFTVSVTLNVVFIVVVNTFLDRTLHLQALLSRQLGIKLVDRSVVNIYMLTTTLLVLGISTSVAVIQQWQKENQARQSLEQAQMKSEMTLLKGQINPHFFFNTLNNIYSLTFIDIVQSRESLHKLSRMMRYLLYEAHDTVPLSKEVNFVRDYVELMRIRLQEGTTVVVEEPGIVSDDPIYPMLLIPFVENAFKHGVSTMVPGRIHIRSTLIDRTFRFEVRNCIVSKNGLSADLDGGIGLSNTRRRLELLYKDRYRLNIVEEPETTYTVCLELNL
ncbi:sensor histidine kinase [Dinghuibacter silviterrae]|uniref:Histidine kinase n=1 Tax=Dinghuibacter silviterrae TaxID=1539049 RepID=A0A4R8DI81_9BACT|nr:histidine kinase [Dinghuibacter silviterrae]TDW97188.1 histidine kinase [Dinghuibacter silviterrae]